MRYRAVLATKAQADIRRMPPRLAAFTLAQLRNLCEAPTALSRPSHFPYRQQCQIFTFDLREGSVLYVVNVLFQYSADEQSLHIADAPWTAGDEIEWG